MMLKPSKAEIREFGEILDQDGWDKEALAQHLLTRAFAMYGERENHGLIFQQDGVFFVVQGFPTALQANKWAEKQGMKPGEAVLCIVKTEEQV